MAAVVVDEDALARHGRWPWPRSSLARLVTAVQRAGAVGVAVDILLAEEAPGDEELAAALAAGETVLVATMAEDGSRWILPPAPLGRGATLAHGMIELDSDGVARRVSASKQAGDIALPALAVAAARLASPEIPVPVGRVLAPAFRAAPRAIPSVGAAALLAGDRGEVLAGRVVFVGVVAGGLGDRVFTPRSPGPLPDPGVLVHAAAAEALVAADLLRPVPPVGSATLAFALVLGVAVASRRTGLARVTFGALLVATPALLSLVLLHLAGAVLPTVTLSALTLLVLMGSEARAGWRARHQASTSVALLTAATGTALENSAARVGEPFELLAELATLAARQRLARDDQARLLAHELKTPLTSVRGLAQLLGDLQLPEPERRRAAHLLVAEADRLRTMIDRLTELEQLPQRRFDEAASVVDLAALVRSRVAVLARGYGRRIVAQLASVLRVRGDVALLERAFDNLVVNAFKYSAPDTEVEVRLLPEGGEAVIAVRDRGCGIPPEEQAVVFERFVRGSSGRAGDGMGLGLALVREVVTWHGGRVELESTVGEGSVFRVRLPLAREEGDGDHPRRG